MEAQDLKALLKAACHDDCFFEPPEGFDYEEEGDWTQDGKYQSCTDIVRHEATGRCFEVHSMRSGSYHTDWYYVQPEVGREVRKVIKTTQVETWEAV